MSESENKSGVWSVCACDDNLNVTTYGKFRSEAEAEKFRDELKVSGAYVMPGYVVW